MEQEKKLEKNNLMSKIINFESEGINGENQKVIKISRKMRWIVFSVLIIVTIVMGFDQGILSSSTTHLMKDFNMTERQLGGFGSMVFFGNAIGCICSFTLINKFNRKNLLLGSMIFDVICLFFTTKISNIFFLYLFRIIAGIAQCFLSIYTPVWSDQFGIHKYKSIMLAIIHLSSSFGYVFGYVLGMILGWEKSFYFQNIMIIIIIMIIDLFLPDKYFSMTLMPLKANFQKNDEKKYDKKAPYEKIITNEISDINIELNDINEENTKKIEIERERDEDTDSLFEEIQTKNNDDDIRKESIITHLKVILKSPIYLLMNANLTCLFIIVSGVQFWINDYLENCLLIEDKKKRLYAFTLVVVSSPPAGIILGGILSGRIGGYDTEKAIYIPVIASFFVCVLANITPLTTKLIFFIPFFWIYLFLGSLSLPVARGIVLVSVEKKYGGPSNAMSSLIYNILGKLPGLNLYAFYKSKYDKNSRIPFWLLLNMAIPGFLSSLICVKFQKEKYSKFKNINDEEEKENILNENQNQK